MGCCCCTNYGREKRYKTFKYVVKPKTTIELENKKEIPQSRLSLMEFIKFPSVSKTTRTSFLIEKANKSSPVVIENEVKEIPLIDDDDTESVSEIMDIFEMLESINPPIYPIGLFPIKTKYGTFYICNIHVIDELRITKDYLDVNKIDVGSIEPFKNMGIFEKEKIENWLASQKFPTRRLYEKLKNKFQIILKISQRFLGSQSGIMRCYSFIGKDIQDILKASNWCLLQLKEFKSVSCETGCNGIFNKENLYSGFCD